MLRKIKTFFREYGWAVGVLLIILSTVSAIIQHRVSQWAQDSILAAVAVAIIIVWYYWNDLDA